MGYYKIYAGLGGGFGGAEYLWTDEYNSEDEAVEYAYSQACELYYGYQGLRGLFNREIALEDNPSLTEDELIEMELEDLETWIDYYVIETDSIDDEDE